MLIFDSNVWIYTATADDFPVEIYSDTLGEVLYFFEDFYQERHRTVLSAYMVEEIQQGIPRSDRIEGREIDEVLTKFFTLIKTCDCIESGIENRELEEITLEGVRQQAHNNLLSDILGIQTKDVPIFLLAYEYRFERPLILTDDSGFAQLNPTDFGINNITIEELTLSW